ncbi:unnamed protein product [Leptidea sinapis]|uniref:Glycosyl hydrolase family 38 C-terminal domain-containing protein n=1 Tax=Leptidea sinapis TaxID=189913 RepID=A0A5E4PVA8_9NEOP|nr:unnamed protein product [Leptidea sinapis]
MDLKYNGKEEYLKIYIDSYRKISTIQLMNSINSSLDIQFYYYISDDPKKEESEKISPGPSVFRPSNVKPEPIIDYIDTTVYKSDISQEIHSKYSNYASFVVRLYEESPLVEVDWVVGPVPIDDGLGKDVFLRYSTDLDNFGTFYTDANGRQTIKRIRHMRATYQPYNLDPVAGNYYPVNSKIYIEDTKRNLRLSIFNDRSQGGSSLIDGAIDFLVHRRILTDDTGAQTFLNDTIENQGVVIRGKHYLYFTKANYRPNKVYEKRLAKEIELSPKVFVSVYDDWENTTNEFTALRNKLPIGVHLLSLEEWNDHTLLLRLENYLEKSDIVKSGNKIVKIKDLFVNIKINIVKETTLAAHMWFKDWVPLHWQMNESFYKSFNDYYGLGNMELCKNEIIRPFEEVDLDEGISLTPQQIRTFVVWFEYLK